MRIIDGKGKLFAKINIIDFLVILFLLCILPAFYFGYKIMTKKPIVVEAPKVEIETDCQFIRLKPEVLKHISVGDKELNESGQTIGEIIRLDQSEPYRYEFDIGKEEKIIKEDTLLKQIKAKLRLKAEVRQDRPYYKNKLIKIGLPLNFKTNKYDIIVFPSTVKREEQEEIVARVKVKFKNTIPEITKVVKVGDRQLEIGKDDSKCIVAKIIELVSNEPAEVLTLISGQHWVIEGHPKYRDLVLEIETLCVRKPEGLFLKNRPLKIGRSFEFSTDLYSISGTIIGIEKK